VILSPAGREVGVKTMGASIRKAVARSKYVFIFPPVSTHIAEQNASSVYRKT